MYPCAFGLAKSLAGCSTTKKRKWILGTKLDIPENGRRSQPVKPEVHQILNNILPAIDSSFSFLEHLIDEHLNRFVMKKHSTNQEILLVPGTNLLQRDWCEKENGTSNKQLSYKEQLLHLCWNGMLPTVFPEICETNNVEKPLTLWEVNETHCMLDLRFGEINENMSDEWSINPYVRMEIQEWN